MRRPVGAVVGGAAALLAVSTGTVGAVTPGYSLPIDQTAFDGNTAPLANCHHGNQPMPAPPCGYISHHWWAIDLFQGSGASIYSVTPGRVARTTVSIGQVRVSLGSNPSAASIHWQYLHGNQFQVSQGQWVGAGTLLMKMSNAGAGAVHVHVETRYLLNDSSWDNDLDYYGFCTRRMLKAIRNNYSFDYMNQFAARGPDSSPTIYDAVCAGST